MEHLLSPGWSFRTQVGLRENLERLSRARHLLRLQKANRFEHVPYSESAKVTLQTFAQHLRYFRKAVGNSRPAFFRKKINLARVI